MRRIGPNQYGAAETLVGLMVGLFVVGFVGILVNVMRNQLMFQPPPLAKMPNTFWPAFRLTVCETVCQFYQPPMF